ncbi:TrmH family RNA methyltransferase [Marinactinospora thermotolerans]|uniref:tRNA (Guanosine-2'-O-)-methyltransferase n=1 Tax=Marinactinospora thermotolerans DSM 45154 TaxID=1122192 RepID=A0A1T4TE77_9ACTN|nr:TrmH family RNA methyltransferase [Marinactinospora thermotolerans]SKA38747.1 tRNA (guanosine-2'-O-)-methyltransferase [Marinactinospora thermotolerans DSM 45154]
MSTQLRPTDVKRLNRQWRRRTEGRLALIAESVTQPFNLGSILRTGATFGLDTLWLTGNAIDPTHPQVGKTALGSENKIHWERLRTSNEAIAAAHADGYRVVAIELARDALPLHEAPLDGDICLAVGAEDHGCSPALLAAADAVAYIPQIGRVGSLNVAVATAIAIAETRRREWQAHTAPAETGTVN